jgi:transcriptional regulator with XRE-family HTH domain
MNKLNDSLQELNYIIGNSEKMDFPQLLVGLRRSHSLTRETVVSDLGVSYLKFFHLENGDFLRLPEENLLVKISEYYGIPLNTLKEKAIDFVNTKISSKPKKVYA